MTDNDVLQEINCYFRRAGGNFLIDIIGPKCDTIEKDFFFHPIYISNLDAQTCNTFRQHHPKVNKKYNNYLICNKDKLYIRYTATGIPYPECNI